MKMKRFCYITLCSVLALSLSNTAIAQDSTSSPGSSSSQESRRSELSELSWLDVSSVTLYDNIQQNEEISFCHINNDDMEIRASMFEYDFLAEEVLTEDFLEIAKSRNASFEEPTRVAHTYNRIEDAYRYFEGGGLRQRCAIVVAMAPQIEWLASNIEKMFPNAYVRINKPYDYEELRSLGAKRLGFNSVIEKEFYEWVAAKNSVFGTSSNTLGGFSSEDIAKAEELKKFGVTDMAGVRRTLAEMDEVDYQRRILTFRTKDAKAVLSFLRHKDEYGSAEAAADHKRQATIRKKEEEEKREKDRIKDEPYYAKVNCVLKGTNRQVKVTECFRNNAEGYEGFIVISDMGNDSGNPEEANTAEYGHRVMLLGQDVYGNKKELKIILPKQYFVQLRNSTDDYVIHARIVDRFSRRQLQNGIHDVKGAYLSLNSKDLP